MRKKITEVEKYMSSEYEEQIKDKTWVCSLSILSIKVPCKIGNRTGKDLGTQAESEEK